MQSFINSNLSTVVTQHLNVLPRESHVSRDPILLLGHSIFPMSRFAERSHKSKKKKNPRIVSLGRLCLKHDIHRPFRNSAGDWGEFQILTNR